MLVITVSSMLYIAVAQYARKRERVYPLKLVWGGVTFYLFGLGGLVIFSGNDTFEWLGATLVCLSAFTATLAVICKPHARHIFS